MTDTLTEQAFRLEADDALERLLYDLLPLAESEGFEVELQNGVLQVIFDDPRGKFVVSPNTPVRQIWVSAMSRSYKLGWRADGGVFEINGESLDTLMRRLISEQLSN